MELLRKVASFCPSVEDLRTIYILYIRSILEQSATVWHSSLTDNIKSDLERVQKSAFKLILEDKYETYENSLMKLDMETLETRRISLCLAFAKKASKNPKCKTMFPLNDKKHDMKTRNGDIYKVQHANTSRLKSSAIIYMQNLLNEQQTT